jgi:hypothetical protein
MKRRGQAGPLSLSPFEADGHFRDHAATFRVYRVSVSHEGVCEGEA